MKRRGAFFFLRYRLVQFLLITLMYKQYAGVEQVSVNASWLKVSKEESLSYKACRL